MYYIRFEFPFYFVKKLKYHAISLSPCLLLEQMQITVLEKVNQLLINAYWCLTVLLVNWTWLFSILLLTFKIGFCSWILTLISVASVVLFFLGIYFFYLISIFPDKFCCFSIEVLHQSLVMPEIVFKVAFINCAIGPLINSVTVFPIFFIMSLV